MTGTGYLSASTCRDKGRGKKGSFERSLATTVGVEEKKSIHPAGGCRCHFVLIPWLSMEKKNNLLLPSRNIYIGYVHHRHLGLKKDMKMGIKFHTLKFLSTMLKAESIARPTKDLYLCLVKYSEKPAPL